MAPLRFRAWLPALKELREFELLSCADIDSIKDYNAVVGAPTEKARIMQSTGLKDRTGKEIFEGDIVLAHWEADYSSREWKLAHSTCVVEFGNIRIDCDECKESEKSVKGWGIKCDEYTGGHLSPLYITTDNDPEYEVIGNVWENPDLLPTAQ